MPGCFRPRYNLQQECGDASAAGSADFTANTRGVMAAVDACHSIPMATGGTVPLTIVSDPENPSGNLFLRNLTAERLRHAEGAITREYWAFGGYTVFMDPSRTGGHQAEITVAVLDDGFAMDDAAVTSWVKRFARLVGLYWDGFPADKLLVAVAPHRRVNDPFGRVCGGGGPTLLMRISKQDTPKFLHEKDQMLTHELVHLGAPFAPARRPWFMEGMATYLELLSRGLGGAIPRRAVWDEWARAMPTGAAAF